MCLSEDPNGITAQRYPLVYAKPLIPDATDSATRSLRTMTRARMLSDRLKPYTMQDLRGQTMGESLPARALPIGFASVRGCDTNWDGEQWDVQGATLPSGMRVMPTKIGGSGLLCLKCRVQFFNDSLNRAEVQSVEVMISKGETIAAFAYDDQENRWSSGEVLVPLYWLIEPVNGRPPVAMRISGGYVPDSHSFSRPIALNGGIGPL
jgi:hypothetical protein